MTIAPRPQDLDVVQTGEGPDLVLVHSLLTDRTLFDAVVAPLSRSFRLTIPNLPGYGATPAVDGGLAAYADTIARVMDGFGVPPTATVLGNGFGGFVSLAFALRHPDRYGKLALVDCGPGFPPEAKEPLRRMAAGVTANGMGAVLDTAVRRMFPESYIAANPAVVEERKAVLAKVDATAFGKACLALAETDYAARLGEIVKPTLVIVGLEDATTPPALSQALAKGIPGARYVEIEGCGHCPPIQAPERFVEEVRRFILG